jgi:hypothetical protein
MVRTCIREVAEQRGVRMYQLWSETRVPMSAVRRYWHNNQAGSASKPGEPLETVNFTHLREIARVLGVHPKDLIEVPDDETSFM